jgi:hypothetical protein
MIYRIRLLRLSSGLRPRGITNLSYKYRMAGLGITNVAQLIRGNTYRLINKRATHGESLEVFTYNGKSEEGLYTFVSKNEVGATFSVMITPGAIKDYIIEEVKSGGRRRNRRAAKKTRRNRRRSSRLRKA